MGRAEMILSTVHLLSHHMQSTSLTYHMKYMCMLLTCPIHMCCHSLQLAEAIFFTEKTEVRVLRRQQLVINK